MSYFKPLNSNENNLHIIRASIDNTGNISKPSTNQLPSSFSSTYISNNGRGNAAILLRYPNVFNSNDIPSVLFGSSSLNLNISEKNSTNCIINSSTNVLPNIDVMIVGSKASGPVFAISNRGWKFSTNLNNDNLLYSEMKTGIGTDDPQFNLSVASNISIIPNTIKSSQVISNKLQNYYMNIIDIDTSNAIISMPAATSNGQLIDIAIGNVEIVNNNVVLNMTSNILTSSGDNLVLQNKGDSVSLCSYNNKWLVINKNITPISVTTINYNKMDVTSYLFSTLVNGKLTVLNIDSNITINLPVSTTYDGTVIDMVVSSVTAPYRANLLIGNILCNPSTSSLVLSNIADKIKLLATGSKWLILDK
jgi:hypothetical protein